MVLFLSSVSFAARDVWETVVYRVADAAGREIRHASVVPRVSRRETEQHHEEILEAATRLFRERGLEGLTLPALMASVGLTHGGFYGHFASKTELARAVLRRVYDEVAAGVRRVISMHPNVEAARRAYVDAYLSAAHRDAPASGCPIAALSTDIAREPPDSVLRREYVEGVSRAIDEMNAFADPKASAEQRRKDALTSLASLVGALVIARGAKGSSLSDDILAAVRERLTRTDR
jgi:TetR/AcrR family transcriptional regulator, transcriptional repressor for nem operon